MTTQDPISTERATSATSRYFWVILGTGYILILAAMGFGRYAYPMLLPSMQDSLGVTYGPMGVLGTVNLIGYLTFSLGSGILATRFGAKPVVAGSMILLGVCMVGLGMVSTYWVAIVLLLLAGIGTAGVFTPCAGLGRAWTPRNMGGFTMGLLVMGASSGILIASYIIPLILVTQGASGWRSAWIYMGIATLAATIIGVVTLKEKPSGVAGAGSSMGWGEVFRNRSIAGICLTYFLLGFYQVYATFFVAYLRRGMNLSTELVGNIWFYWAVLGFLTMMLWGIISDRIGRKWALAVCVLPLVFSVFMPLFWQDIPLLYASAMLYGATFGGPVAIVLAAAADVVPVRLAAAAVGLVTAFFGLGQAVSPTIAGYLTDLTGSFYPGFAMSGVVMLMSLVVFVLWPLKRAE